MSRDAAFDGFEFDSFLCLLRCLKSSVGQVVERRAEGDGSSPASPVN